MSRVWATFEANAFQSCEVLDAMALDRAARRCRSLQSSETVRKKLNKIHVFLRVIVCITPAALAGTSIR